MYTKMETQLESVRKLKVRKHKFLEQLNDISYLLNIKDTDIYVDKVNDITDRLIKLHQQKFELDKKILDVDIEFSNINHFIKEENNIDIFDLVVNSEVREKYKYLDKLNEVGLVSVKEYEESEDYNSDILYQMNTAEIYFCNISADRTEALNRQLDKDAYILKRAA